MDRHRHRRKRRLGLLVLALAAAAIVLHLVQRSHELAAAPHTIHTSDHPFDADWPDVYLILASKCAGCHRPGGDLVDLTSYAAVVRARDSLGRPVVVPGDPQTSPLWEQVVWNVDAEADTALPDSPNMPDDSRQWLTRGQLETLARWIRNGALEYRLPATCAPRPLLEIDFPSAQECKACHPRQYEQWARSMHHYAEHSPIFEAFNLTLIERTGGTLGTFCSRCHTPLGTGLGENGSRRNVHRSRLSMEGVTCVVCHRQSRPYYKSNARQHIMPGGLIEGCMYGPFDDPVPPEVSKAHDATGRPHFKTSAFCGSCHDVTNPAGTRLEEAYSEWQNSPAARQGITCQQCHMGPVQGVPIADDQRPLGRAAVVPGIDPERIPLRHLSDHTFAGPDYPLLPDTEFPEKLDWMYETDYRDYHSLTPYQQRTLNDLRRHNRRQRELYDQKRYELLRNAAVLMLCAPTEAAAGSIIGVRADVTSKFAGHSFPTGFTAERQVWVEITLFDPSGQPVFRSGDLDPNGDLRDAHSYAVEAREVPSDPYLLNFQNKFVALTQEGTERPVVLAVNRNLTPLSFLRPAQGIAASFGRAPTFRIAKGSLPPLTTMGQAYPIQIPTGRLGDYLLEARLNFRHIPPTLMDHIGIPHLKHLLEIVELDRRQAVIQVR